MIQISWTIPRTWSVNETLTAANMNTHLRDQLNWLANDHPRCSAIRTAAQSIPNSTSTEINLTGTDEFDVGAMHDPGTNPNRITVPSGGGGIYHVEARAEFAANAAGRRNVGILVNGVAPSPSMNQNLGSAGGGTSTAMQTSGYLVLAATDWVSLVVFQDSGGSLNVNDARLQVRWVAF